MNLSRRNFMKTTGAVSAAAALGISACDQTPEIKGIPIGLQLYSVREQVEEDLPGTLKQVAQIGYQGVEFAGYFGYQATEMRKFLDDNGLKCCGSHLDFNKVTGAQLEATAEYCLTIGCKNMIVPSIPEEQRQTIDDWKELADTFNKIAEIIKQFDLRIGYHNHKNEFQELDGEIPWYVFADNTTENVILQLDTGNGMAGGANVMEALKKYPGRATTLHCKGYSAENENAIVGEGDVPWQQVIEFCRTEGGTEWFIIEEENKNTPPMQTVENAFENFLNLKQS
ncbi:MAG: TIM barrel protein [candidate division KSB1 bacterium]|nr:TIM barrel protein [candidate division KSB1 bacterium]